MRDLGGEWLENWWQGNSGERYVNKPLWTGKTMKTFVSYVNVYQRVTSAEEDFNSWMDRRVTYPLEWATHSSVLAYRIPGMGQPDGLPSMGSHRVIHDWSDLAAAGGWPILKIPVIISPSHPCHHLMGSQTKWMWWWGWRLGWKKCNQVVSQAQWETLNAIIKNVSSSPKQKSVPMFWILTL